MTPRALLSLAWLLPGLLAACAPAPLAAPGAAPAPASPAAAPLDPPQSREAADRSALRPALQLLDEALAMRHGTDQWAEVRLAAQDAGAMIAELRASGRRGPLLDAAQAATEALVDWQDRYESGDPARLQDTAALLDGLAAAGGRLPQTHAVRTLVLLESGRAPEAAVELARALQLFPANPELNDLARAARDELPDPAALARITDAAAARQPEAAGEARATSGHLLLAAGLAAEAEGDATEATRLYEQGAAALAEARADPRQRLSGWTLGERRADCLANAGRLHRQRAQDLIATAGLAAARLDLQAAEKDYGDALAELPDDEECHDGLAQTADLYYQAGDLEGVRDAFGRLARRFDDAEWWNNHAFFCRETGLYEESFAAYEKCVALEPWNARYVNDTALILLYHLDRDLDRAEAMFRKAIELARTAGENPFVDDEDRAGNLLARTDAMLNLAVLLARTGRLDEAAAEADALIALAPERADARQVRQQIEAARQGAPFPDGG